MSISQLQNNIKEAKEKIASYESLISSISSIRGKLDMCSLTLNKTGELIGQAIVLDGKAGDNGNTAQIAGKVSSCSSDFAGVSELASAEIVKLNKDIISWQNEIARLQEQERARERERLALLGGKK